jgi:RNA polymerase sigma factor (sigma-70 family)
MIRLWLGVLIRKFSSGRQLVTTCGTARERRSHLHFEELEDRAVPTILDVAPVALVVPGTSIAVVFQTKTQSVSGDLVSALNQGASATGLGGPALNRLLEAVEKVGTWRLVLPSSGLTAYNRLASGIFISDGVGDSDSSPTPSMGAPGSGAAPPQSPPVSASLSPGAVLAEHTSALPISPADVPRPDTNIAPPGTDPKPTASTDSGRTPPARPTAPPEVAGVRGAPTAPATTSQRTADGNRAAAHQVGPSRSTDARVGRSPQEHPDRAASDTSEVFPASRPRGTAELPAARTNVKRSPAGLADGPLLQRFVAHGDQAAFTALVQRHERFVLRICQCVLGDSHTARDAFQATFLVLARKAARLDGRSPLTGWLYKVAYHLALRLRARAARQRRTERNAAKRLLSQGASELSVDLETEELRQALREELQRLPEKYRVPLILCYFDGRTHAEAARAIGLPRGSIAKRIGEGLERLRERLLTRGFML